MNGTDITRLLKNYNVYGYKGVWTIDTIPNLVSGEFIIYNLSAEKPGTHWAYLYCRDVDNELRHYEVFDSLGAKQSDINKILQKGDSVIYNSNRVQPKQSDKCGLFACYFAIILNENEDLDYFDISDIAFVSDKQKNDEQVLAFFSDNAEY